MLGYMALSNKIDTRLAEKFVKKLPLRVVMACLTGGTSLLFSGPRQAYQVIKKNNAIDAVKTFVNRERRLRDCDYVEWNTFPQSHIVIGGSPMDHGGGQTTCPLCKRHEMRKFVADSNHEIFTCDHCGRILSVKVNRVTGRPEEVLIPGLFTAAIPFTDGIEHLGDLALDMTDLAGEVAGWFFDLLA
jgi:glutaredoxin-related protein